MNRYLGDLRGRRLGLDYRTVLVAQFVAIHDEVHAHGRTVLVAQLGVVHVEVHDLGRTVLVRRCSAMAACSASVLRLSSQRATKGGAGATIVADAGAAVKPRTPLV